MILPRVTGYQISNGYQLSSTVLVFLDFLPPVAAASVDSFVEDVAVAAANAASHALSMYVRMYVGIYM